MNDGPPAGHQDDSAPKDAPNNGEYLTPTEYAPFPEKDGYYSDERKYGPIEQRAFDIQISSPVEDVEELFHRTHLTAQFHAENKDYWLKETPYVNKGGHLYDLAILDLFEEKLKCEDIIPSELKNVSELHLKIIFVRLARKLNGKETIAHLDTHLFNTLVEAADIDYDGTDDIPSYDELQGTFRWLKDEGLMDAFEAAVTRAVYSVYRAGIVPPDAVKEAYNFDAVEPPLDEGSVPRENKKDELRRYVELLLERTIEPLTFGRDTTNTTHDMTEFIGAFAASALFDCGFEQLKDVCDWNYPRERIPGGNWPGNYISGRLEYEYDIDVTEVESYPDDDTVPPIDIQFNAVHNRTLALAKELGFWSESDSLDIGVDMFRIDWSGESIDATMGRPPKAGNDSVTEQWTFVIAGGIQTKSRFVLGGRWLPEGTDYPEAVDEILSNSRDVVDINSIFVDSESVGGELIDTLRTVVGKNWVISAPKKGVFKGLLRLTPRFYAAFARDVKWGVTPRPNAVTYPTKEANPSIIEIDPDDVMVDDIQKEEKGENISVPLDSETEGHSTSNRVLGDMESIPQLTNKFEDLESQPGIGDETTHAVYMTDRSLPEDSAADVRIDYIQRWAIESTVKEISNNFMPLINSKDAKQRLYGLHIAILFYNWHTMINRSVSPGGLRLDVSYHELLQAIQHVAFSEEDNNNV